MTTYSTSQQTLVLMFGAALWAVASLMRLATPSNRSPASGNLKISGRNSLLSSAADPRATDTSRPEVRGRDLFLATGCTTCHLSAVFSGKIDNVNTGVERLEGTLPNRTPTVDTGDGQDRFQIPQLFGLRKQHFFHTGLLGNNTVSLPGETQRFANIRQAVADIARFLEAISVR